MSQPSGPSATTVALLCVLGRPLGTHLLAASPQEHEHIFVALIIGGMRTTVRVWRSENKSVELALFFHLFVGSEYETRATRLVC